MTEKKIYYFIIIAVLFISTGCIKGHEGYDAGGGTLPTNYIIINASSFTPASLTVSAGSTITFVNRDIGVHSIRTDDSTTIQSNNINPGTSYIFKKDTSGIFYYHCSQHPTVRGTFILTP
ncbi:MAG TPA: cupredoxin domain-containing protein [Ferruginibacter sp.]|nr:cupredoxin domain-containing protein [Ferruginibacter sp.]